MFFFFKHSTAYDIRLSIVGSEMIIRDSGCSVSITEMLLCYLTPWQKYSMFAHVTGSKTAYYNPTMLGEKWRTILQALNLIGNEVSIAFS